MGRTSKEEVKKREAAKKKVEDLLDGVITVDLKDATKVASKLDELQTATVVAGTGTGGNEWLETQVTELGNKNKELEDKLLIATENYNKILDSTGGEPVDESDVEMGVRKIFNEMNNNYTGNNQTGTKYTQANVRHMLEKFLKTFPFLTKHMKKR